MQKRNLGLQIFAIHISPERKCEFHSLPEQMFGCFTCNLENVNLISLKQKYWALNKMKHTLTIGKFAYFGN